MGLLSRNVAIVMALLVALHAAQAAPANKDGDGKGGKGKGRRSVEEEGLSSFEEPFADALAEEDAEAALVLEEQVRARRSLSSKEVGAVYAQDEASADDGAALQAEDGAQSQLVQKKPCRGSKGGSGGSGGDTTGTDAEGGSETLERQREGKSKRKKTKSSSATTESSALVSWLMSDVSGAEDVSV